MTQIRVRFERGDGSPLGGALEVRPTARHKDGNVIVTMAGATFRLDSDGDTIIDLAPTAAGWCWHILERVEGGGERYVAVPTTSTSTVVEYADLAEVAPDNPTNPSAGGVVTEVL